MARPRKFDMTIFILLGWTIAFISRHVDCQTNAKQPVDPSCVNTLCSCCLDTVTCSPDGKCGGQCQDGFFGGKCRNTCPDNCISCKDPYNPTGTSSLWSVANCTQCKDSYYSTSQFFQCQFNCPPGCQACNSITNCTVCLDGYFKEGTECTRCKTGCDSCTSNNDCTKCAGGYYNSGGTVNNLNCISCSDGCINQCDSTLGTCTCKAGFTGSKCDTCADGRYGDDCSQYCQSPCRTCTSRSDCTSCVSGYYWDGNNCQQCQTGCAQCSSSSVCTLCKDEYYSSGTECVDCSDGCSNMCDKVSGTCSCRPKYTGDRCDTCIDGWYGSSCNAICSQPCKACTSSTECKSCIDRYVLQGTTCSQCKPGCAQCSTYNNCTLCMAGYYSSGTDCVACSRGCSNQCNNGTGTCSCKYRFDGEKCDRCLANFNGTDCDRCINNYHGSSCDQTCPSNCKNKECTKNDGTCSQGCIEPFTGSKCTDCVVNFAGETCDECTVGRYGPDCRLFCSSDCKDTKCGRDTGACDSCPEGKYGDHCNRPCPPNCEQSTCIQNTGACIGGCKSGYSGDMCCLKGSNCKSCSSASQCSECSPTKYGETCDDECPTNCADGICDKTNGTCNGCIDGFQGESCALALTNPPNGGGPPGAAIGGGVAGAIVVIVVVVVIIIILRRRSSARDGNTKPAKKDSTPIANDRVYENGPAFRTGTDNYGRENEDLRDSLSSSKRTEAVSHKPLQSSAKLEPAVIKPLKADLQEPVEENEYYNSGDLARKGIPVKGLAAYVDNQDAESFKSEFSKLPKGLIKPTDEALKEQNLGKNRYNGIYPYDETRVVLEGPGSDFINACYVEGFRKRREYIASLGPIAKATEGYATFWRMVWQEKTEKIVMVTNLMENGGMKCEQYWPDVNETKHYGDITVACHSQDVYSEYTVRSFTVEKGAEQRSLHHIHYTAWPDKGVPDDVTSLIEFRNNVNATKVRLGGPVIVHCSAGVGRTGTYIALDILTYKGKKTGYVDIFDCVEKLRQQRTTMVQTAEQYEYVHRAIVHTLTLGSEAIPAEKFQSYASSIPDTVFDKLNHCKEKVREEEKDAVIRNKSLTHLNRQSADIPGDNNRPRLFQGRTAEDNNYINAVYVNSFKMKNHFIMTQTPLPTTVNDFLTLVIQENCSCIVSIDPPGLSDKSIGTYLPADNQDLRIDSFEVKSNKLDSNNSFTRRTLEITANLMGSPTTRTVHHYQCNNWPGNAKSPSGSDDFLKLVYAVQKTAEEAKNSSPVIVHCRTGSERSGLLCVVVSLLQKIEIEHEVSVINTVRQVKVRRPKAIPNKEQFVFAHKCVAAYLQTFDIYSNFS